VGKYFASDAQWMVKGIIQRHQGTNAHIAEHSTRLNHLSKCIWQVSEAKPA